MKIQIIGMGVVGSTIANNIILCTHEVDTLILCDVNERFLLSQFRDLSDAKRLAGKDIKLRPVTIPELFADIHILCVGMREYKYSMNELMNDNYALVKRIAKIIGGKMLIVTNPADKITRRLKYKGYDAVCMGDKLDEIRKGMGYDGKDIRLGKGYTNFGISSEVLNFIKKACFVAPIVPK